MLAGSSAFQDGKALQGDMSLSSLFQLNCGEFLFFAFKFMWYKRSFPAHHSQLPRPLNATYSELHIPSTRLTENN